MTNDANSTTAATHQVINVEGGSPIRAWTVGVPFEAEARAQLERIARLPFIHRQVAVMPDVHLGNGATVGSVDRDASARSSRRRSAWTSAAA